MHVADAFEPMHNPLLLHVAGLQNATVAIIHSTYRTAMIWAEPKQAYLIRVKEDAVRTVLVVTLTKVFSLANKIGTLFSKGEIYVSNSMIITSKHSEWEQTTQYTRAYPSPARKSGSVASCEYPHLQVFGPLRRWTVD